MRFAFSLLWLFVAGPLAGTLLARATGSLTWWRAAFWTAICQLALVLLYLGTQLVPTRSYGHPASARGTQLAAAQFAVMLSVLATVVSAVLTAVWRLLARTT